jgi:hypothetical protein
MKHLREFFAAVVLTCVLSLSVHAGEISCPGVAPPPSDSTARTTGQIECGLSDFALLIIQRVLSLM